MEDKIIITVRDINGNRETLKFKNRHEVLVWADNYMDEDIEVLVVAQGNLCLYSGLQSDVMLTCDDITGFFC